MRSGYPLLLFFFLLFFFGCSRQSKKQYSNDKNFDRGIYLYWNESSKKDSAFLLFSRYVNTTADSLKKGAAYNYMALIQSDISDLYGAQESLAGAMKTLDPQNKNHWEELGYTYNVAGNVKLDLKLFDEAINFYNTARSFSVEPNFVLEVMNGKAMAFQRNKKYIEAIAMYDSILALSTSNQELVARVIDNSARTKWLQDPAYNALPAYRTALKIRLDSQYRLGLDASYAHLSDYYATSNKDSALWYAQKMYASARENQHPADVLEALEKLIILSASAPIKQQWYIDYKNLRDSLQFSGDTTRNRFALIRYDVQKSKADNLSLQQHVTQQRLLIFGLAILAVLITGALTFWYRKRRARIRQQSEEAIREAKLKTSKKVHDVVANGLYNIMNELEHNKGIDREPLITKIETLYEKSRDISYEDDSAGTNEIGGEKINALLSSFGNEQTKVFLVGSEQDFWNKLTGIQKQELDLVLNEIMVNMRKHSYATNVVVNFGEENGWAVINYKDDGIGFVEDFHLGNGLKNTVNRIYSLGGEVNFDKNEKAGAVIRISFPLNH